MEAKSGVSNVMPTSESAGVFQNRKTVLGVCTCGREHPIVWFEGTKDMCAPQTCVVQMRAFDNTWFEELLALMPEGLKELAIENGLTNEEQLAVYAHQELSGGDPQEDVESIILVVIQPSSEEETQQ